MNIGLIAFGSRGDIQPFLALALALRGRGHEVKLAAPIDFEAQISAYGIPYVRIPLNSQVLTMSESAQDVTRKGITPRTLIAFWREVIPNIQRGFLAGMREMTEAFRGSDLLIAHGFTLPATYAIHQHLQIPLMLSIAAPVIATRLYPCPTFPPVPFGGRFYNPLSYHLLVRFVTSYLMKPTKTYRQEVGLPPISAGKLIEIFFSGQIPVLLHYSRHLMPAPSDWNPNIHIVGSWSLPAPAAWLPPAALTTFLTDGTPPVFFGFGSMPVTDPARMVQTLAEALRLTNLRGVLQAGWAGLEHTTENLITIGDAPHEWLFSQMAAVVHHGGSGTTHSALSAGKPALIVPFVAD